ncbi:MAG: GSCFA domain-containing protein [Rhizobacter sp.]
MHPYQHQPERAFWNKSVANKPWFQVEFESGARPWVTPHTRLATAGSCFASNLLRFLPGLGLKPFFTEQPPSYFSADEAKAHGYGEFAARYGNVYTVRQLRQLVEQALGLREPIEAFAEVDGAVFDLLRPHVRPGGFKSMPEARADRRYHLACVKKLFTECEVFVFTLGLTEAWVDEPTGTVFPVCPGTVAGRYDPTRHKPVNFDYSAIAADLNWVIDAVGAVNPDLKWIITVSPVHLVATHTQKSVIVASTYSKAVLRAVCGDVERAHDKVSYFPSFEIFASAQSFGQYLGPNLRDATDRGVSHVISLFDRIYVDRSAVSSTEQAAAPAGGNFFAAVEKALNSECDELHNEAP